MDCVSEINLNDDDDDDNKQPVEKTQ